MQPRGQVRFDVLDPYVFALKIAPGTGVLDLCGPPWWRPRAANFRALGGHDKIERNDH